MRIHNGLAAFAAMAVVFVVTPSVTWAQPDVTQTAIISEADGFPGVCPAPCFEVEKTVDVFFDGNPSAPAICPAGHNTYLYSLTHLGGTLPAPSIPITGFTLEVDITLVTVAGFIPGAGIAPTSTTISPLNTVSWEFPDGAACPACLDQGKTSEDLFICSPALPGTSPNGALIEAIVLDASGDCIVPVSPVCGNGVLEPGEECDDGNNTDADGCQGNCLLPVCGDGIVDTAQGEECDDGNTTDGDGCQGSCNLPFCGDGIVDAEEGCDDGNNADGDGCSGACVIEGACCSDGPNTESECFITTMAGCAQNGNSALYLGNGSICTDDLDCVGLTVTMDEMSAEATPEGVLVSWTTVMEIDTVGFRILREMPSTPDNREKRLVVIAPMIAARGNLFQGSSYVFLDNAKESDEALNYHLEDIDIFGRVTRHGPISIDRGERQVPTSRADQSTRQR